MDEGAARGDGPSGGGLGRWPRIVLRALFVTGTGFGVGLLLTAPIVGWPHAFPGVLINAPEPLREAVGLFLIAVTPIAFVRWCRRWIVR
jgi:hypothetical protein